MKGVLLRFSLHVGPTNAHIEKEKVSKVGGSGGIKLKEEGREVCVESRWVGTGGGPPGRGDTAVCTESPSMEPHSEWQLPTTVLLQLNW